MKNKGVKEKNYFMISCKECGAGFDCVDKNGQTISDEDGMNPNCKLQGRGVKKIKGLNYTDKEEKEINGDE